MDAIVAQVWPYIRRRSGCNRGAGVAAHDIGSVNVILMLMQTSSSFEEWMWLYTIESRCNRDTAVSACMELGVDVNTMPA